MNKESMTPEMRAKNKGMEMSVNVVLVIAAIMLILLIFEQITIFEAIGCMSLVLIVVLAIKYPLEKVLLQLEYNDESEEWVLKNIFQDKLIRIVPVSTGEKERKFWEVHLPKKAVFYAIRVEKDSTSIFIKWKAEEESKYYFLEQLDNSEFLKYYGIAIETETISIEISKLD